MGSRTWFILAVLLLVGLVAGWTLGSVSETKKAPQPAAVQQKEENLQAVNEALEEEKLLAEEAVEER